MGGANAVIYTVATWAYVAHLGMGEKTASMLGFCTAVPFAFLGHRAITFSSRGFIGTEWIRFVATQLASMATSVAAMWLAVDLLGQHFAYGVFAGIVLVPIFTYLVLNRWVFRHQPVGGRQGLGQRP